MIKFISPTEQICYITVPKDKAKEALHNHRVLLDSVVYEHKENLHFNENEVALEIVLDLSNTFDLTNNKDFNNIKNVDNMMSYIQNQKKKLIRYVEPEKSAIYRIFHVKYRIIDCSAIKKVSYALI